MPPPFAYLTRWHTTADFEPERREWFRKQKAGELLDVGFLSARGYEAAAFPNGCNLYELDDLTIFQRPAYRTVRSGDRFVPAVVANFTYNSKTFYDQIQVVDGGGAELATVPTLSGAALSILYFDAPDPGAVVRWFKAVVGGNPPVGARTCRLWRQTGEHPEPTEAEPEWCAVVEWDAAGRDDGRLLREEARALSGLSVTRSDVLTLWHGAVREEAYRAAAEAGRDVWR